MRIRLSAASFRYADRLQNNLIAACCPKAALASPVREFTDMEATSQVAPLTVTIFQSMKTQRVPVTSELVVNAASGERS
jgi:hypothetical protein